MRSSMDILAPRVTCQAQTMPTSANQGCVLVHNSPGLGNGARAGRDRDDMHGGAGDATIHGHHIMRDSHYEGRENQTDSRISGVVDVEAITEEVTQRVAGSLQRMLESVMAQTTQHRQEPNMESECPTTERTSHNTEGNGPPRSTRHSKKTLGQERAQSRRRQQRSSSSS